MSLTEPPVKKMKVESDINFMIQNLDDYILRVKMSAKPIKIILEDDIVNPVPSIDVFIGRIKDKRLISKTILLLNEKLPLTALALQHLKRVRRCDVLLCPVHFLDSKVPIQKYLEQNIPDLNDTFDYFKEIPVAMFPPKVSAQYTEANKLWSVNFHPDKYLESIVNNTHFRADELKLHRQMMTMTFDIAKWHVKRYKLKGSLNLEDINVAVVVDPSISSIVAVAVDNRFEHPMQHAAMVAIDNVAKTQKAGAWLTSEEKNVTDRKYSGIDGELFSFLNETFTVVKLGARTFETLDGLYLCTSYYIYMMREPCVMCTMGLIHARIKRAFFCFDNENHGALHSRTMLHLNPSLNHRFEAYTGFL